VGDAVSGGWGAADEKSFKASSDEGMIHQIFPPPLPWSNKGSLAYISRVRKLVHFHESDPLSFDMRY
jgi:hypothetical protein